MKKRLLALFLAFVMAMSLLPVSVFADGGTGGQLQGTKDNPITASKDGVTVNKYVSQGEGGQYNLTLEAYAENKVTSTTTTTPLDIVLVLDTSGSMNDSFGNGQGSRLSALKTAVDSFIGKVAENAKKTEANHQISIVTFNDMTSLICELTPVSTDAQALKAAVKGLSASGATGTDEGMKKAENVLKNAQKDSERIVILFTDGVPTRFSDYSPSVAHDAVNAAKRMKDVGVTVYTIGIFPDADPSNTSTNANKFMNAVSSNYPNAKSDITGSAFGIPYKWTITLGRRGEGEYYFASSSASDLENVFDTIANTVTSSTLEVNPDEDAVLSDTLSEYFNFPEGLADGNYADVTVQKVPVVGKSDKTYTWGEAEAVSGAKVTVTGDKIEVTGFNYKENAVTEKTENGNTTYGGYKLVVTFPIEVDENACLENPVETGVYPTNSIGSGSLAGLSYKSSNSAGSNNASTTLSGSPAVHLTDLDGNGTDVKVQVYVDGTLVTEPFSYITLTRDSGDTSYDYIKTTVVGDGTINCDFNYDPDQGQHDCIDLEVTVTGSVYVLQGVSSYQDYGMSGTDNVRNSGNNKYVIDNVTAVGSTEDVNCKIYLRTKYSVEYYQGDRKLTEEPYNDSNIYVSSQDVQASTDLAQYPTDGNSALMGWKNDNCKTSVALPALPTVENHDVSGWYLGSATNTATTYTGSFNAISEDSDQAGSDADDNIICFYATTALKSYDITINYQDETNQPLKTAHTESKNSGEQYSFDVSKEADATIPFIIDKGETQYVFNQIKSGSLSGTVTGPVNITAEYLLDSDKDGTPDKYEATVTYKVVNGTWSDETTDVKTANFILKTFDQETNTWKPTNPTLGSTIPTGMQPDETHVAPGAWDTEPTANTLVTGPKTYTYTFNTTVNSKLKVEKTLEKVNGEAYTTGKVEADDVLTYTIKVTNTGNVSLSNIVVTDTFTGSAAPVAEGVTWNLNTETGKYEATWNISELAAGADATLTYTYTVRAADQGKTITNNAVAASGDTTGSDTNEVTVYNPDMTVTKAVTKVNNDEVTADKTVVVQKDDVLTYTITVKNTGDQDLTNVVVTDTKWSNGTKITVSGINDPVTLTGDSYTIGTLNVGDTVTITYTYTVTEADVKAEKVTNNVSVKSKETPGGESGGTTTNVVGNYTIEASSGANGTISPNGSVTVTAGADQAFTITADAGYHISDVTVDGVSKGAVSSYTFKNVQANHTIRATFAKDSNPTSYTLYYHPNFGGYKPFYQSSSTRSVTVKEYENVGRLPERDGYVFVSWNTEPDGSGERYMPGDPFHIKGSSDHLYAQWQKDKTGPDDSGVSNWLETDEHRAYLTGYPDSTFRADRNMTRAEVAQMFYALLLDKNVTITKSFSDVPDDAWYATAVKTLASLGMMDGYPDGTFRPDEPITRAEFATVGLAFAYDPLDASCSYYDVGANAWYYTYVAQATTYGWIGGYPDNTFRPGNNITRVEVCVIVNNMLGRDADERYIDRHEDELVHFVDLSDSYWGYYTIMESTNTHEYTGSFTNEKWTDVK
ncbi:S-layer homology domain-containing protein [Pseudoflavonifractor sp. P01025]|uniref:S-layer homology domain-containing protein n=1 Tax=Flintibacter porci TaxID=3342383 RepID=UPI0035B614F9